MEISPKILYMPVFLDKAYNNGIRLLVWQLTETTEELLTILSSDLLTDADFSHISNPQKQREFLGNKVAVIRLAALMGITFRGVGKDEDGKPYLIGTHWHMSVTNSAEYTAAAFHPGAAIGIDIEKPSLKMWNILPRLFTPGEVFDVGEDLRKMSVYWSAKEALYKLYGKRKVDFRRNLAIYEKEGELMGEIKMPDHEAEHLLLVEEVNDYLLVMAI